MTAPAKLGYGVAAACFAVVLQKSSEPQWWDAHPVVGVLIGASIPICTLAAWLSETRMKPRRFGFLRFVPHSPEALALAAWAGVVVGLLALMLFLFTVSTYVAVGFLVGGFLLGQFIDMTTPNV
jgi:hypothetical protein